MNCYRIVEAILYVAVCEGQGMINALCVMNWMCWNVFCVCMSECSLACLD